MWLSHRTDHWVRRQRILHYAILISQKTKKKVCRNVDIPSVFLPLWKKVYRTPIISRGTASTKNSKGTFKLLSKCSPHTTPHPFSRTTRRQRRNRTRRDRTRKNTSM